MSTIPRRHSKYAHIFVVVRFELDDEITPEHRFSLTKAYADYDTALREADRLNELKRGKKCRYVVHLARMVRPATPG